jgi:hypothetical protein
VNAKFIGRAKGNADAYRRQGTSRQETRETIKEVCMTDVWVYQGKDLKVFASAQAAQKWFDENDQGLAFKCEVDGEEEFETMVASRLGC